MGYEMNLPVADGPTIEVDEDELDFAVDAVVDDAVVAEIAASFRATGRQISNIIVRPLAGGKIIKFIVVAGVHRVMAARAVGWASLRAVVLPYETATDRLLAGLVEIDENLKRKRLTPAVEALLTARRKQIYEKLHPETRHGSPGVSRQVGDTRGRTDADRFSEAQARATGRSERAVQRAAARGEALLPQELKLISGTALDKGDELDWLAKLAPERRVALIERAAGGDKVSAKTEFKKQHRQTRERALGERQRSLPTAKFGVILADPEWRFETWSEAGLDRAADNHYPTSPADVILERPVAGIAADDCALFLWATVPMLPAALTVMKAWGFAYKSHFAWVKDGSPGTGYWNRNDHELLLVGTRGNIPCPAPGDNRSSVLRSQKAGHSEKPVAAYELIEAYFPTLPKIELNARARREGWEAWGLEAPVAGDSDQASVVSDEAAA